MADLQQVDATKQTAQDVITGSTAVGRVENKGGADLKNSPRRTAQSEIRTPPHSIEAEQGVLGCILLEPQESLPLCIQRLKANENAFYDVRHRVIYEALLKMYEKKCVIDPVTVVQWLKDKNNLETAGGVVYITSLPDATPSAANLDYYLTIVRDKYFLRKMIYTCTDVISKIYDFSGDVEELLDNVETKVLMAGEERVEDTIDSVKDLVKKAIEQIEHYHQNKGMFSGILTGFSDLDKLTLGLQPGDMIVIAARPSVGKTSLAMNIVEHVAVDLQIPVGVFSLEMTAESLILRTICSRARVNLKNIREGFLLDRDFAKIVNASSRLSSSPLFIDDTSNMSILELRAKARRMVQRHGIKLFVIDYLQLLHSSSERSKESRQQEIAEISRGIKALAKELNVPVIVLSQLNREIEKEKNRKPRLSDLRESGAIEQDADFVGLLYQPGKKEEEGEDDSSNQAVPINLYVAKQRNGPTGEVNLIFLKEFTRFENLSKIASEDVPVNT